MYTPVTASRAFRSLSTPASWSEKNGGSWNNRLSSRNKCKTNSAVLTKCFVKSIIVYFFAQCGCPSLCFYSVCFTDVAFVYTLYDSCPMAHVQCKNVIAKGRMWPSSVSEWNAHGNWHSTLNSAKPLLRFLLKSQFRCACKRIEWLRSDQALIEVLLHLSDVLHSSLQPCFFHLHLTFSFVR